MQKYVSIMPRMLLQENDDVFGERILLMVQELSSLYTEPVAKARTKGIELKDGPRITL